MREVTQYKLFETFKFRKKIIAACCSTGTQCIKGPYVREALLASLVLSAKSCPFDFLPI